MFAGRRPNDSQANIRASRSFAPSQDTREKRFYKCACYAYTPRYHTLAMDDRHEFRMLWAFVWGRQKRHCTNQLRRHWHRTSVGNRAADQPTQCSSHTGSTAIQSTRVSSTMSGSTDLALDQENGGNADAHEDDDRHDHRDLAFHAMSYGCRKGGKDNQTGERKGLSKSSQAFMHRHHMLSLGAWRSCKRRPGTVHSVWRG